MKTLNVTQLKSQLSKYLRQASRGGRILVQDRDEPLAEIGPPSTAPMGWRERLAEAGRLRPGTQDWAGLNITKLGRRIDTEALLRDVREDPHEVRRR